MTDARGGLTQGASTHRARGLYAWTSRHFLLLDWLLALALWGVLVLTTAPYVGEASGFSRFLEVAFYSMLVLPLAYRRRFPVVSAAIIAAFFLLQLGVGLQLLPADMSVLWVVYALAAFGPRWASVGGLLLALAGGVAASLNYDAMFRTGEWELSAIVQTAVTMDLFVGFAWVLGYLTRSRRRTMEALRDRAHRLEVEQQQERDLVAADERNRIARELHDIVAHSLSVIITQADGGRYAAKTDPGAASSALETIAVTGRESLAEMRRLLGVLRDDGRVPTSPAPSLADLAALLDVMRSAGLTVSFAESGGSTRRLPIGAELVAYRVVQESLTNVLKHAGPGTTAEVRLEWTRSALILDVLDDGRGLAADALGTGTHQGIRGMKERVALYGGRLEAGPRPGGGFRVHATIPFATAEEH